MTAIKIEKNVPIPSMKRPRGSDYPFGEMKQGDSIFVPCKDPKVKARAISSASLYGKRHGVKFTTRTVPGGIRIWLIATSVKRPAALEAA
jgi:hypothetical protein